MKNKRFRSKLGVRNYITTYCKFCNSEIKDYACNKRVFCNLSCKTKFQNKFNNPSKKHHWKNNPVILEKMKKVLKQNLKNRKLPKGNKHHAWRGDRVGYYSLHNWVSRELGKAKRCDVCGLNKPIKNKKRSFCWANLSGEYKRDINDWKQMCYSCHKKYDLNRLGKKNVKK